MRARAQVREELGIGVAAAPPGTDHRSSDQILTGQEDFQRADDDGGVEVTIFSGPDAHDRALQYADSRYRHFVERPGPSV